MSCKKRITNGAVVRMLCSLFSMRSLVRPRGTAAGVATGQAVSGESGRPVPLRSLLLLFRPALPAAGASAKALPVGVRVGPRPIRTPWFVAAALLALLSCAVCLFNPIATAVSPLMAVSNAATKTAEALEERFEASPLEMLRILAACTQYGTIRSHCAYTGEDGGWSNDVTLLCNGIGREFAAEAALASGRNGARARLYLNQERLAFSTPGTEGALYGVTFDTYARDVRALAPVSGSGDDTIGALTALVTCLDSAIRANHIAKYEDYSGILEHFVMNLTPVEGRELIVVNGSAVSCKTVKLELTEAMVEQLAGDLYGVLREDSKRLPALSDIQALGSAFLGTPWQPAPAVKPIDALGTLLRDFDAAYKGSAAVTFYIRDGGLVRCIASVPALSNDGRVLLTADFGLNPQTDTLSLTVREQSPDSAALCDLTLATEDGPLSRTDRLTLKNRVDTVDVTTVWDKETNALSFDLAGPGTSIAGVGTLALGAGAFTLAFDDLRVNGGRLNLSLSAEKGVTVPSPDYVDLTDWGRAFLDNVENPGQLPG